MIIQPIEIQELNENLHQAHREENKEKIKELETKRNALLSVLISNEEAQHTFKAMQKEELTEYDEIKQHLRQLKDLYQEVRGINQDLRENVSQNVFLSREIKIEIQKTIKIKKEAKK